MLIADNRLETAALKFANSRARSRQSQEALRCHHDQRTCDLLFDLASEQVKVLCRRRWVTDLHIVLGTELQVAFEPRRRVLGPLSLITVRKQHYEPRSLLPLVLRRR